jgi:hypothetical protein
MKLWEKGVSWLVLLLAIGSVVALASAILENWTIARDGFKYGAIPIWALLLPVLLLASAGALVARSRWCLPMFLAHVVLSFLYISLRFGVSAIGSMMWLWYCLELLIVAFCLRLLTRGLLK